MAKRGFLIESLHEGEISDDKKLKKYRRLKLWAVELPDGSSVRISGYYAPATFVWIVNGETVVACGNREQFYAIAKPIVW